MKPRNWLFGGDALSVRVALGLFEEYRDGLLGWDEFFDEMEALSDYLAGE